MIDNMAELQNKTQKQAVDDVEKWLEKFMSDMAKSPSLCVREATQFGMLQHFVRKWKQEGGNQAFGKPNTVYATLHLIENMDSSRYPSLSPRAKCQGTI
jgi:hypothetical protein